MCVCANIYIYIYIYIYMVSPQLCTVWVGLTAHLRKNNQIGGQTERCPGRLSQIRACSESRRPRPEESPETRRTSPYTTVSERNFRISTLEIPVFRRVFDLLVVRPPSPP